MIFIGLNTSIEIPSGAYVPILELKKLHNIRFIDALQQCLHSLLRFIVIINVYLKFLVKLLSQDINFFVLTLDCPEEKLATIGDGVCDDANNNIG